MVVNKNGMVFFFTFMLGISIIVLGIALASPAKEVIDNARSELSCNSPSTDWDEATCYFLDIQKFYLIGGILLIGVAILGARRFIT
ncbi:MAG: hypothetical protein JSW08_00075 [archaeon]|nr:MAG: hypothetical protein JSW08_00075 [archaeon]